MPTSQKLDDEIFTTENHHENSVIVEEVGDEIEAEVRKNLLKVFCIVANFFFFQVVSMKDDFGP